MNAGSSAPSDLRGSGGQASRRAILVLGMHRSGTSAVTRCLNLLGVDLGKTLLPPKGDNPKGFWESMVAVEIHEKLLGSLDRSWNDARPLPKGWLASWAAREAREQIAELIRSDFGNSVLWAVKDPRLCRLVPLWREILTEQGVDTSALLVVRHPQEVALSLQARDGLPEELTYLSWLQHFAEAEADSRGLRRSIVSYEGLLLDWRGALARVARDLQLEWPVTSAEADAVIDAYLNKGERHHKVTASPGAMPEVLAKLYRLCRSFESQTAGWAEISGLINNYREMAPAFQSQAEVLIKDFQAAKRGEVEMERAAGESLAAIEELTAKIKATQRIGTAEKDGATLYWRTSPSGFAESQACTAAVGWEASPHARLHFELPAAAGITALRFDPSSRAGAFNVSAVRLNGACVGDLRGVSRSVNQYVLDRRGGGGIWFASIDSDPWIELDVTDLIQSDEPLIVEIDCERRPLDEVTGALMAAIADDMRRRVDLSIESVAQQLSDMQGRMQQRIDALQTRGAELERHLAAERERAERVLAAERERAERDLAAEREHVRRLNAGVAWQTSEVLTLRQNIHKTEEHHRAVMAALRTDYATQHAAAESLRGELVGIHASTLWRALIRLRGLLLLVPANLRSMLRRAAKAVWWLVTPWRVPARLRFLKHRQQHGDVAVADPLVSVQPDEATHSAVESSAYTYRVPNPEPSEVRGTLLRLSESPLFSVIVPVYNTDPVLLRQTIESVQSQWYPNWELILVDDHSQPATVGKALYGLTDPRISVVRLEENQRISGATNEGIRRATGEYIVFLDHDDELTPDCLYELALCIDGEKPDYLYSDEDKLSVDGSFTEPFFKPDWSPDTMMSIMLTCHVSCVRRSLALEVGGLRREYDGSQDWDFVLRVTERARRISHIPKVLYHWRIIPKSCASDLQAKPYAIQASKAAREDALRRRGLSGELVPVPELPGYFRTRYHLQGKPLISIVIPTKNNGEVLKTCIDSIFERSTYRNFEVLVINNGSTDTSTLQYLAELRHRDQVKVLDHDVPFNYSEINNYGIRHSRGELLVFLNDDTEVISPDWLDYMGGYAQLAHVGAVGAKLLYPKTLTVQHTGVVNFTHGPDHAFKNIGASDPGYFCRNLLEHNWVAVTGACLMIERKKFDAVGGFDEDLAVAYNDVALCFSLVEHGFYQVVCPSVKLLHYESLSRGDDRLDPEKLARIGREQTLLYGKHPRFKGRDPFYNQNFAIDDLQFGIPRS